MMGGVSLIRRDSRDLVMINTNEPVHVVIRTARPSDHMSQCVYLLCHCNYSWNHFSFLKSETWRIIVCSPETQVNGMGMLFL